MPDYAAVLLAGGRSSRMGRDKALLPHPASGLTLIRHQLDNLVSAGAAPVLLSLRSGQEDYTAIPASIPRVRDCGSTGPLGALAAAFATLLAAPNPPPPHLLVLAVDMPWIDARTLRSLLDRGSPGLGVAPHDPRSKRFEPLCAVYPLTPLFHRAILTALDQGLLSLQTLLTSAIEHGWMTPYQINDSELTAFQNWNRPDDLGR
ncbi:MAG: NTP transferase domain-containing protein [Opitutaceae bacterium]|nr:NTP transferase domain-containing protein [Opitutaceae bacterium]